MANVLIVFSDPNLTEVPAIVCDDLGYSCLFAHVNEIAEHLALEHPDLALVVAPDAVDAVRTIRDASMLPVVVVVREPTPEKQAALRQAGAGALVFHPYSIQTLRRSLSDELRHMTEPREDATFSSEQPIVDLR